MTGMTMAAGAPSSAGSAARESPILSVRGLGKTFRRADKTIVPAVVDVSLDVFPKEFVVLLGPSGCGKTTLLRCIAGLEKPERGTIEIDGRTVYASEGRIAVPPEDRRVGMVFQSYALWPHLTVFENVAYPLRAQGVGKAEIAARVGEALALVGIPDLARQHPSQMSGGQQQRVALARAVVANSRLVLFDEPLSNVDAKVREQLRQELMEMQHTLRFAAVYVTHDQIEAMALADRIAALRHGRIEQLGSPRDLYLAPRSRYVASFIGTANTIDGRVAALADGLARIDTALGPVAALPAVPSLKPGDAVAVVFRPERSALTQDAPPGRNAWSVTVVSSLFLGPHCEHVVRVGDHTFQVWTVDDRPLNAGATAWLSAAPEHCVAVPADE